MLVGLIVIGVRRVVIWALALLVFGLIVVFILENSQSSVLTFFGWSSPQLPFSIFIIMAMLLGLAAGLVMGWFMRVGMKRRHGLGSK